MAWTVEELAVRVAHALTVGAVGSPNGRVGPVPDRRMIRWYTTIGLVDRPLARSGRVASYGHRHLLQLVAIKRRQAAGASLAEIQAELLGATDAILATIADLPPTADPPEGILLTPAPASPPSPTVAKNPAAPTHPAPGPSSRPRFWAEPPPSSANSDAAGRGAVEIRGRQGGAESPQSGRKQPPLASSRGISAARRTPSDDADGVDVGASSANSDAAGREAVEICGHLGGAESPQPGEQPTGGASTVEGVYGVRLDDVVLLLPGQPATEDLAAIRAAAQPLLDLLVHRGLSGNSGRSTA